MDSVQSEIRMRILDLHCQQKAFCVVNSTERVNPLPDDKFWTLPNWKSFQTTISNLTKNGKKLSTRVENTVGKGEIARYEQFLLFPQCFQKACYPWASKGVIVWEWVKAPFSQRIAHLDIILECF